MRVSKTISGYTTVLVRWKNASVLIVRGRLFDFKIDGSNLMAVCIDPLVQRWACCLKAIISGGSSAGAAYWGRYTNCQPLI